MAAPAAALASHASPAASAPVSSVPSAGMPPALAGQLKSLEDWALANRSDARRDTLRFWMLKIPAILVSASSGVFAYFKVDAIAVVAGAIASLCVLIDGLNPGGALRNVHLRAFNELRKLEDTMLSNWQVGELRGKDRNLLAAEIIERAEDEKARINLYITAAETSLAANTPAKRSKKPQG